MPLNLNYLHNLTNEQLDQAIQLVFTHHPVFLPFSPAFKRSRQNSTENLFIPPSPYHRLADLISSDKKNEYLSFGLSALKILLGIRFEEMHIYNDHDILYATRIFLKFILYGKNYTSGYKTGQEKNDTCLHDALRCGTLKWELTKLLLQNGADTDQENADHLTALALHIQQCNPYLINTPHFALLNSAHCSPLEKLKNLLIALVCIPNQPMFSILELMANYDQFSKHPGLLNYYGAHQAPFNFLLHLAVIHQPACVVRFMLDHGANPHLLNRSKQTPLHLAVNKVMNGVSSGIAIQYFQDTLESITYLFVHSLQRQLYPRIITALDVVSTLLSLDIRRASCRERIAELLFILYDPNSFSFTKKELFDLLAFQSQNLQHSEITISKRVGNGAFGFVYEGKTANISVAIKLNDDQKDHYGKVIRQEAAIHSQLCHPNIVRYICAIERYERLGFVMEYANQGTLANFIEAHSTQELADCFYSFTKQINAGLNYLHSYHYVHLDFKCANILIDMSPSTYPTRVLLADFGATAKQGETRDYDVTTYSYCSPERFNPHTPYCYANDIFSFAIVMGEMETKEKAWLETGYQGIKESVCAGERTTFNHAPMRPKIAHLVHWCWQQQPVNRPHCAQIDAYLEQHLRHYS
jgi:ankyrin repeat protein